MHKRIFGALAVFTLGVIPVLTSGCVTLDEHHALERKSRQQETIIQAADRRVTKLEIERKALENQIMSFKERVRTMEEAPMQAMNGAVQEIIQDVKNEGFEINPSTNGIVLEGDILFSSGKATLKGSGEKLLQRLVEKLKDPAYADYTVEVAGHTDSDPIKNSKWADNWQLSLERARNVLTKLETHGFDGTRMKATGYGPHMPRDMKSKKLNRRVELLLTPTGVKNAGVIKKTSSKG